MAELERDDRGSVGPAAMVRIYGNDTGLLLKAIRITEKRRRETRTRMRGGTGSGAAQQGEGGCRPGTTTSATSRRGCAPGCA